MNLTVFSPKENLFKIALNSDLELDTTVSRNLSGPQGCSCHPVAGATARHSSGKGGGSAERVVSYGAASGIQVTKGKSRAQKLIAGHDDCRTKLGNY